VRNAFLALLVVNLAYFAWSQWIDAPPRAMPAPAASKLPTIKLAGEVTPAGAQLATPAAAHKMALNESAETARCVSIGPFADIENSAQAASVLKGKGFDVSQRAAAGETSEGYWVYVGGLKSDTEVATVIRDLIYHGISDAHAMADAGAQDRRVSVGLFSERDRADKRAKQVQHLGIKAEVAEHNLPVSLYWLDVTPEPGTGSVPIDELLSQGLSSKVRVQACPAAGVAANAPPPAAAGATPTAGPVTAVATSKLP
jgi:SPOR domain